MNRKNTAIFSIGIIISFTIGYFIGDTTAINRTNSAINKNVTNTLNSTSNSSSYSQNESKNYKFGEEGKSGNWNIKVLDSQEATTIQGGDNYNNKTTQQKFIIIKLQMTDIDSTLHQYSTNEFILRNAKNKKQYSASLEAMEAANQKETIYNKNSDFFGVYDDISPNTPKQTYVVFEVPKDFNIADGVLVHGTSSADLAGYYIK